jgi:hypothetical protein
LLAGPRSFPAQLVRKKAREAGTASGTERAFSLRRTWRSLAMDLGIDHAVARLSLGTRGSKASSASTVAPRWSSSAPKAAEFVAAALDRIRLGEAAQVVPLRER